MRKRPADKPQMPPNGSGGNNASLEDLKAKIIEIMDTLFQYETNPHELKYIRSEEDMIEKMPLVEKTLDLAFEHQELLPPGFLEKFWENNARFLIMKDIYEKSKNLREKLEKICPPGALPPYKTDSTING
jgi:hypothetical protein